MVDLETSLVLSSDPPWFLTFPEINLQKKKKMVDAGLEPATSALSGRHSNQLNRSTLMSEPHIVLYMLLLLRDSSFIPHYFPVPLLLQGSAGTPSALVLSRM